MPVRTVERIQKTESWLKKTLAEKGQSMDPDRQRGYKKRLRRAQRKRRRLVVEAARIAPKAAAPAGGDTAAGSKSG